MVSLGYGEKGKYGGTFQSLADMINKITALKQLQREDMIMQDFQNKLSQARTGDDVITLLSTAPAIQKKKGIAALLEPINPFTPSQGPTNLERNLNSTIINEIISRRLRQPVGIEREALKSQIAERKARTKYYEQGGARTNIKIISPTSMTNYGKQMDQFINHAKKFRPGGYNYKKDDLLRAWEGFKEAASYDVLPENQQLQLRTQWNTKIQSRGSEYEWEPSLIEPATSTQIPTGLESIWGEMTEEERQTARNLIEVQGFEPQEIVDYFKANK
jgi:hypothetical protein